MDKNRISEGTENKLKAQKDSVPSKPSVPSVITKQSGSAKPTLKSPSAKVFDMRGKSVGAISLPKEVFGQKPNERLLAQAIRIYSINAHRQTAHTKTRGEVRGGGAKPWRQKGTGRARAGSIRSPLWVGGGTTFGPRTKDIKLSLPKKMKRRALTHALSAKAQSGRIKVIANVENIKPKTKIVATLLTKLQAKDSTLFVISKNSQAQNIRLATRNIPKVSVTNTQNLNAYEIIKNNSILFSREAISQFK